MNCVSMCGKRESVSSTKLPDRVWCQTRVVFNNSQKSSNISWQLTSMPAEVKNQCHRKSAFPQAFIWCKWPFNVLYRNCINFTLERDGLHFSQNTWVLQTEKELYRWTKERVKTRKFLLYFTRRPYPYLHFRSGLVTGLRPSFRQTHGEQRCKAPNFLWKVMRSLISLYIVSQKSVYNYVMVWCQTQV